MRCSLSAAVSKSPRGGMALTGGIALEGPSPMPAAAHLSGIQTTAAPVFTIPLMLGDFFLLRLREGEVLPSCWGQAGHSLNPKTRFTYESVETGHFCWFSPDGFAAAVCCARKQLCVHAGA